MEQLYHLFCISVSVYYVAVRIIVLSRHGSSLARPVIIHDIIHSLMCMPSTPHCGFSGVSPDGNCTYVHWGSFTSNSKSVRGAIWFTWFSEPHDTTSLHDVLAYTRMYHSVSHGYRCKQKFITLCISDVSDDQIIPTCTSEIDMDPVAH